MLPVVDLIAFKEKNRGHCNTGDNAAEGLSWTVKAMVAKTIIYIHSCVRPTVYTPGLPCCRGLLVRGGVLIGTHDGPQNHVFPCDY